MPYHGHNQANGLAFGIKEGTSITPSLQKIFDAIEKDVKFGLYLEGDYSLEQWAKQGVLLFNTILTVERGQPLSHAGKGWEIFTASVIDKLNKFPTPLVFLLWGKKAQEYKKYLDTGYHYIIESEHPAAACHGQREWINNDCFNKANEYLDKIYGKRINW